MNRPTRRAVLAGTSAAILAVGGITAVAAAAESPDAALLALAAEVCRLEDATIPLLRAADLVEADPGHGGSAHLAAQAELSATQMLKTQP